MSWITEINELLNDILNYWDEPVLTVFNIDNYKKCYLSIISAYCYFIFWKNQVTLNTGIMAAEHSDLP